MSFEPARPVQILLVEDNPADIELVREMFEESKVLTSLAVVEDGDQALEYLLARGEYHGAASPDMVLLDLNLPGKSGLEVLKVIKEDPNLRRTPVVVMTTSADEQDVLKSYEGYANSYVTKPLDFEQFLSVMRTLEDFWFGIVRLPSRGKG